MQEYKRKRETTLMNSRIAGIAATLVLHIIAFAVVSLTGLKYIYPPPEETGIEIEFEPEPDPVPIEVTAGSQPRAPEPDRSKDIRLAKASEAPYEGTRANEAEEAVNDDFGDVETPDPREPEKKKEIDKRALFPSADNKAKKDTLAAQTAAKVSNALSSGHALGNTKTGANEDYPNVHVQGRRVEGSLPSPEYTVQESGTVVVKIIIDRYGKVIDASVADGSTTTNKQLWDAAIKAALKTRFNVSEHAAPTQEGTIRYIFNLN